jgi:VWFA-related protein
MRWYLAPLIGVAILSAAGLPTARAQEAVGVQVGVVDDAQYPRLLIPVTVTDSSGRPVGDLPPGAFTADANGAPVTITNVTAGQDASIPASVVLTFDASGSMQGAAIQQAREAGKALVNSLGPSDQVAVLKFAQTVELVQAFTNDRGAITAAIDGIQAGGNTALYDGVVSAVETADDGAQRRAVVLLSDGQDFGGASRNTRESSLARAQAGAIPFFVVGLGDSVDQPYLQELAGVSRGQVFLAPAPEALQTLYAGIGTALRSQYILEVDATGIDPAAPGALRVSVNHAGRSGVGETPLDLGGVVPPVTPPPPPTLSAQDATPEPTAAPPPVVTEEAGGSSSTLLMAGMAGAGLAVVGMTAAGVWMVRRRRPAIEEPAKPREPPSRGAPKPVIAANTPIFVGTGPEANGKEAEAWLDVVDPESLGRFPLGEDPVTVGFTGDCTVYLPNGRGNEGARVRVWRREGRYMLHNLSRLGRVTLAGKPATWAVLEDGDEILVGSYRMVFHDSSELAKEPAANSAEEAEAST